MSRLYERFLHLENVLHHQFVAHSVAVLRIAVGVVFFIAAATFRGGRVVRSDLPPTSPIRTGEPLDGSQKLSLILQAGDDKDDIAALCARHELPKADFYAWRETARAGQRQVSSEPSSQFREQPETVDDRPDSVPRSLQSPSRTRCAAVRRRISRLPVGASRGAVRVVLP
jgi:hypothetical protein